MAPGYGGFFVTVDFVIYFWQKTLPVLYTYANGKV
jgi:hypothetical protein